MSNFDTIKHKLGQFVRRYYTNELLKGVILFFAIGLLYLIVTLFVEYMLWLNPSARTVLFWTFIAVEFGLFVKFIAIPLLQLFNIRKGINFKMASKIIGNHFPQVNDKLLNVLQLNENPQQSDLLIASIEQKSQELQPIPFKSAINFRSNFKYLKYAAVPLGIILLSVLTGKMNWFSDSYKRVVNYQTAYEPPAPFQFFVVNESLNAIENKAFKIRVSTLGEVIPESAQIQFNGESYFLQPTTPGEFEYVFTLPKESLEFTLTANNVVSKPYVLEVIHTPSLLNFQMILDYPSYTNKQDEVLKSTGSTIVPEGTLVTWRAATKFTTEVVIYADDTLSLKGTGNNSFEASKRLYKNYNYNISTSNDRLKDYENIAYSITVLKDAYPEISIELKKDSLDDQSLYFFGQANDDYGLNKLHLVYYPSNDITNKKVAQIPISSSNFSEFLSAFPNQLDIEEGVSYELYFEVFDNDAIHNYKSTKSNIYSYRKRSQQEEEQKQLNEQNETIKDISKTFEKLQEQDKKLEEFSKTQKEKETLNFNDKQKFEEFLKRQKQQEQLMKNFNKKLQDNLEEFQNEKNKDDEFKEDLKERLKENEEQLKQDEKVLQELEELKDKINKEEFTQKLEELAKQNKNKKRSMKQLLELTKRFYVMKKAEKISRELKELSEDQKNLTEKNKENTKKAQEDLNRKFKELQKGLDDLKQEDRRLQKPMNIPRDEAIEESIKQDQKRAEEALEMKEEKDTEQQPTEAQELEKKAKENQKKAAKKMKEMSEMMEQMMSGGGGGGSQMSEDIEMLRQILDNLVLFSFDQEGLMEQFSRIDVNNNKYGKYIIEQSNLREHFEHIDDSLFALSLRQPKLSEKVNAQITDVYFNIDNALGQLTENRLYQGLASQQYAITASNELASFLSDVLDNMEMSMNPSMGSGGEQQLEDIIMSQEELNKMMEEGVKKNEKGEKSGKEGEQNENGEQDDMGGKKGDKGSQGEEGQGIKGNQQRSNTNGSGGVGKNGKTKQNSGSGTEGEQGKKEGYGEGGSEELNGELFKIYQQQQQLRQALQEKMAKDNKLQSAGELIKQMEEVELDLLNTGFTNQTLQKMMDLQHQLLKMESATFMQGQDNKRKAETNKKNFEGSTVNQIPTAKAYFNATDILNRKALPLQDQYKKKLQEYFKNTND